MRELSEQERFWQGDFGNEYVMRNQGQALVASNLALFSKALQRCQKIDSVLEFGTNRGLNLQALSLLLPKAKLSGVELNQKAYESACALDIAQMWHGSLLDYPVTETVDLTLSKGVLIHLAPDLLPAAYEQLHRASTRYILLVEYYNPVPVEVSYRGNAGVLFKRDFAGEMLAKYSDLKLSDYGFVYKGDPLFPQDDATWFLLEKK